MKTIRVILSVIVIGLLSLAVNSQTIVDAIGINPAIKGYGDMVKNKQWNQLADSVKTYDTRTKAITNIANSDGTLNVSEQVVGYKQMNNSKSVTGKLTVGGFTGSLVGLESKDYYFFNGSIINEVGLNHFCDADSVLKTTNILLRTKRIEGFSILIKKTDSRYSFKPLNCGNEGSLKNFQFHGLVVVKGKNTHTTSIEYRDTTIYRDKPVVKKKAPRETRISDGTYVRTINKEIWNPYESTKIFICMEGNDSIFQVVTRDSLVYRTSYDIPARKSDCDTCKQVVVEKDDCPSGDCPEWDEPKLCLTSIDFGGHIAFAPIKENVMEEIYHAPVLPTGTDYGFYVVISEANGVYNITAEWGTTATLINQPAGVSAIKVWYGTSATGSPDDIVGELSSISQHNASQITLVFVFGDGTESKAYSFETEGGDYTLLEDKVTTFSGGKDEYTETVNVEKSILPIFVEAGATWNIQNYPITFGVGWYHIINSGADLYAGSVYGSIGLMSKKGLGVSFKAYTPSKWTIGMNNSDTPKLGFVTDKWSFGVEVRIKWFGLQITKFNGGLYVVGDDIPDS